MDTVPLDENILRNNIASYLLTSEDSFFAHDVLAIIKNHSTIEYVRITGDSFFGVWVSDILGRWNVKIALPKNEIPSSAKIRVIRAPSIYDRKEDLPKIITYFIKTYMADRCKEFPTNNLSPKHIGTLYLTFLISCSHWREFNQLRIFIEQSLDVCTTDMVSIDESLNRLDHLLDPTGDCFFEKEYANESWEEMSKSERIHALFRIFVHRNCFQSRVLDLFVVPSFDEPANYAEYPILFDRTQSVIENLTRLDDLYIREELFSDPKKVEENLVLRCLWERRNRFTPEETVESIERDVANELGFPSFAKYLNWTRKMAIELLPQMPDGSYECHENARKALGIDEVESKFRVPDEKKNSVILQTTHQSCGMAGASLSDPNLEKL
ncbi:MAG: hypothetical protein IIB00_03005 [candidate division Zixibacteria bacterium]|nr:hypothetical protein [candidate division Zixibacteria bacterium]